MTQKSTTRLFTLADLDLKDQIVISEIIKKHLKELNLIQSSSCLDMKLKELNLVQSPYCFDIKLLVDIEPMEILE